MNRSIVAAALLGAVVAANPAGAQAPPGETKLTPFQEKVAAVLTLPHRGAASRARDKEREPVAALHFCRMTDTMTVIEWGPGAGWYTEILAPLLGERGSLTVAAAAESLKALEPLLKQAPMAKVKSLAVDVQRHPVSHDITVINLDFATRAADLVLSIREYHNLAQPTVLKFDRAVLQALKPGGYYCIKDHTRRHMEPDTHENRRRMDPVKVIKQVLEAGFEFVDYSDLFWRPDDELRYEVGRRTVTGNTDRFFLLFRKPAK